MSKPVFSSPPRRRTRPVLGPWMALFVVVFAMIALGDDPPPDDLPAIFNGRDLAGWRVVGEPYWRVVEGSLVGENDAEMKGSMLFTERSYGDVVVEADVRFEGRIDSGIMVRKPELQVQIGESSSLKRDMTCSFYTGTYPEEARAPRAGRASATARRRGARGCGSPRAGPARRRRWRRA